MTQTLVPLSYLFIAIFLVFGMMVFMLIQWVLNREVVKRLEEDKMAYDTAYEAVLASNRQKISFLQRQATSAMSKTAILARAIERMEYDVLTDTYTGDNNATQAAKEILKR